MRAILIGLNSQIFIAINLRKGYTIVLMEKEFINESFLGAYTYRGI